MAFPISLFRIYVNDRSRGVTVRCGEASCLPPSSTPNYMSSYLSRATYTYLRHQIPALGNMCSALSDWVGLFGHHYQGVLPREHKVSSFLTCSGAYYLSISRVQLSSSLSSGQLLTSFQMQEQKRLNLLKEHELTLLVFELVAHEFLMQP